MKKIKWYEFKASPMKYLVGSKEIRVDRRDGSYLKIKYYSPFVEDGVNKIDASKGSNKKGHRCGMCGSPRRVLWVVPFDAKYAPGWYCYKCRRSKDILDIKDAKRYGKVI